MVHEDTLDAVVFVCDRLEERMYRPSERWEQDCGVECVACGKRLEGVERTPEEQRHQPGCELVAKLGVLRAFVRVEQAALAEEEGRTVG